MGMVLIGVIINSMWNVRLVQKSVIRKIRGHVVMVLMGVIRTSM